MRVRGPVLALGVAIGLTLAVATGPTLGVAIGPPLEGGVAIADSVVTVKPPPGAAVPSDGYFRTVDGQPTIPIEASDGVSAQCSLHPLFTEAVVWNACGAALPGCTAVLCASFRPPAPVTGGQTLDVQAFDASGSQVGVGGITFDVDTTPPDTKLALADAVTSGDAVRPTFTPTAIDDDPLQATVDVLQCSLGRAGAPPSWAPCPTPASDGSMRIAQAVPRTHVDYEVQARAVDDLGRPDPSPATAFFDPVPCVVSARAVSIAEFIAKGLPVTVQCSYFHHIAISMFSLGENARHYSLRFAYLHHPALGEADLNRPTPQFTIRKRLRLFKTFDPYYRSYRTAYIAVRLFDLEGPQTINEFVVVTIRR